jgi:membrane protein required for beta-lactamase induction
MRTYYGFRIGKFVVLGIVAFALFTFVVMLLWNWLIPVIFNGPVLTFWQAAGLLLLSKIIFSGIWKDHKPFHNDRSIWRKKFEEKLNKMSEEDREKFKSRFHGRWFHHRPFDEKNEEVKE